MRRVALTGAAGAIGRIVLDRLAQDPATEHILALDLAPLSHPSANVHAMRFDVRRPLVDLFRAYGIDTAIHFAFVLNPAYDRAFERQVNVGGTRNFFTACAAAGVQTALLASSSTAYGAWPDNPPLLTEDAPLRGKPGFGYVEDKLVQERLSAEFAADNLHCRVIVIRPSVVIGKETDNYITRFFRRRVSIVLRGYDPPAPVVYEDDVGDAVAALLREGPAGAYNLDAPGTLSLTESAQRLGGTTLSLPAGVIRPTAWLAWRLRLSALSEAPPAMLDYVRYPWALDGNKVTRATSFSYRYTAAEALDASV